MSRLNDLLRRLDASDPDLAKDLRREVDALASRRSFGLNFERHVPEAVELPGRPIRKGDKVRILPPRGVDAGVGDKRLWRVVGVAKNDDGARTASLELLAGGEEATSLSDDLVVVAEFRDPIYPGLASTGKVERGGDKPFHTIINAENYHALQTLLFTHRGKVDCIYIDPPYNTGAKDWKYNNDYVEGDDLYRHSKWLAFMERRLTLARDLLNPNDSALIIAIDEKECARLALLLEQLFPDAAIQMVTVSTNKKGSSRPGRFSRTEEYLFFVLLGDAKVQPWRDNMLTEPTSAIGTTKTIWNSLLRRGDDARRQDRPNMFYPVWVDNGTKEIVLVGDALGLDTNRDHVSEIPGAVVSWPLRSDGSEGRWQVGAPRLRELVAAGHAKAGAWSARAGQHAILFLKSGQIKEIAEGTIDVLGRDADNSLLLRRRDGTDVSGSQAPRTMWVRDSHDASIYGSTLLRSLIPGRKFPFPKSLYAVEDALRFVVGTKPNAIVVDFFAGSGTTAHAVMRLNRQDGVDYLGRPRANRTAILVTNNEVSADEQVTLVRKGLRQGDTQWEALGICEHVTAPRLRAAVTGVDSTGKAVKGHYKFVNESPIASGLAENIEFFTLTYEAPLRVSSNREFRKIAPLLWMRAGSRGRRVEDISSGWDVADAYGVIADLNQSEQFVKVVAASETVTHVFIVTDEDRLFEAVVRELPEGVEPVRLYEAYLRNFEIETGRSTL